MKEILIGLISGAVCTGIVVLLLKIFLAVLDYFERRNRKKIRDLEFWNMIHNIELDGYKMPIFDFMEAAQKEVEKNIKYTKENLEYLQNTNTEDAKDYEWLN